MKFESNFRLKILFYLFSMLLLLQLQGQNSEIDSLVMKIYNQEFRDIPAKIEALKIKSGAIAQYLEVDYLWWKMIAEPVASSEMDFLLSLDSIFVANESDKMESYSRLFYFIYKIRFDNLKQHDLSKYITIFKFHIFLDKIRKSHIKWPNTFMLSLFNLVEESETLMQHRLMVDFGYNKEDNLTKYYASLEKIENMQNTEYTSFEIIKLYYLGKIYLDVEKDDKKALSKFLNLSIMCPGNKIFKSIIASCQK